MPSTLTPACPLCGLGYPNRALLELHLREDHPRHRQAAGEVQPDAGSRASNEVIRAPVVPQPRSPSRVEAARRGVYALNKRSRQMLGRMAARFGLARLRH